MRWQPKSRTDLTFGFHEIAPLSFKSKFEWSLMQEVRTSAMPADMEQLSYQCRLAWWEFSGNLRGTCSNRNQVC